MCNGFGHTVDCSHKVINVKEIQKGTIKCGTFILWNILQNVQGVRNEETYQFKWARCNEVVGTGFYHCAELQSLLHGCLFTEKAQKQIVHSQYWLCVQRVQRLKMVINRKPGKVQRFVSYIFMAMTLLPFRALSVAAKFDICRLSAAPSSISAKFVSLNVFER